MLSYNRAIVQLKCTKNVRHYFFFNRAVCGIVKQTLIVNLPGSMKGSQVCAFTYLYEPANLLFIHRAVILLSQECFKFVEMTIKHAVNLLRDEKREVKDTHKEIQVNHANNLYSGSFRRSQLSPVATKR